MRYSYIKPVNKGKEEAAENNVRKVHKEEKRQ